METVDTYEFRCRCNRRPFEINEEKLSSSLHLLLGILTLGGWFLLYALYRMGHLFNLSRCPVCGKRSRALFWFFLILVFFTVELGRTLHFFLISAPQQIVTDASFAELPSDLDVNAPLKTSDLKTAFGFVWVIAALPAVGMFMATYWVYLIFWWLCFLTLIGFTLPSFYRKRHESY